jgi:hypothetical protein
MNSGHVIFFARVARFVMAANVDLTIPAVNRRRGCLAYPREGILTSGLVCYHEGTSGNVKVCQMAFENDTYR